MRICIAAYDTIFNTGGVTSWVARFLRALKEQGHSPSCLLYSSCRRHQKGTLEEYFRSHAIPYHRTRFGQYTERSVHVTERLVRRLKPDIFIPNCMVPAWFTAPALEAAGIPCVGVSHSDDPFYHALVATCVAEDGWYQLSGLVNVSSYLNEISHKLASPRTKIIEIPCGIDPPETEAEEQIKRRGSRGKFRIAYVGRFVEEQKRVTRVAECICEAARQHPSLEGYFIGSGPSERHIRAVIERTGMRSRVQILGWMAPDAVTSTVASMDAITLLSDYEGLPVSLLEAMSVGVIPITTRMRSGIDDLIQSGKNGLTVLPCRTHFGTAIESLISNPELRRHLSLNAQDTIKGSFLNDVATERWLGFLSLVKDEFKARPQPYPKRPLPDPHPALQAQDQRLPPFWVRAQRKLRPIDRVLQRMFPRQ